MINLLRSEDGKDLIRKLLKFHAVDRATASQVGLLDQVQVSVQSWQVTNKDATAHFPNFLAIFIGFLQWRTGLEQAREHAWFHYAAPELRRSTPLQSFVIPAPWQEVGQ